MASTTQMVDDLIVLLERVVRQNRIAQLASLHTKYTNEPSKKPDVSVEFRMVRVTEHSGEFQIHGGAANSHSNEIVTNDSTDSKTWKIGDWFAIEVRNRGSRDTYMSILDVQPNGYVSSVYPPTNRVSEVFHPTGTWMTLGLFGKALVFQVGEPCGVENMYLIATEATAGYVDFSRLSDASVSGERDTSRGKNKVLRNTSMGVKGSSDISQFLFGAPSTRGPRASTVDSPNVDVCVITYEVTK